MFVSANRGRRNRGAFDGHRPRKNNERVYRQARSLCNATEPRVVLFMDWENNGAAGEKYK